MGQLTTTTRPRRGTSSGSNPRIARISLGRAFTSESSNYYFLLGTTLFLVVLGLVMVLSSSSVDSYTARQGFFGTFAKQGLFALIGIPLMLVISRLPMSFWKRWGWLALAAGAGLQLVVLYTPLGVEVGGNLNWIDIGGINLQPSELIKLGLVIWLAVILAKKQRYLHLWTHVAIPVIPVAGGAVLLVMLGGDLGTVMIMAGLIFGALFFAGIKLRMLALPLLIGAVAIVVIAFSSSSRVSRIGTFLGAGCTDYSGECWQTQHGLFALAAGGFFGVGLGNSKAKWSWLPAADNDFIFAIIGEELGMIGALVVIALFVALAVAFLRIVRSSRDLFSKVVSGSVMVWIISQAFVNIAVVLGVVPVLGVPLPLISSGGSALITTLVAIGVVLSIARQQTAPDPAEEALEEAELAEARELQQEARRLQREWAREQRAQQRRDQQAQARREREFRSEIAAERASLAAAQPRQAAQRQRAAAPRQAAQPITRVAAPGESASRRVIRHPAAGPGQAQSGSSASKRVIIHAATQPRQARSESPTPTPATPPQGGGRPTRGVRPR